MARRRVYGENPLDLIVPKKAPSLAAESDDDVESSMVVEEERMVEAEDRPDPEVEAPKRPVTSKPKAPVGRVEDKVQATEAGAEAGQYLTFVLAGEEYGVGILDVREIIEYDTLTRVPMTPGWVRGVLNLRGNVVPVIDLALKFGLPATEFTDRTCVVIVELEQDDDELVMGVLVDRVSQVTDLESDQIEPPPAFGTHIHVDYLLGMGRLEERFVLLLDVSRVLASEELTEVEGIEDRLEVAEEEVTAARERDGGDKDGLDSKPPDGAEGPQTT